MTPPQDCEAEITLPYAPARGDGVIRFGGHWQRTGGPICLAAFLAGLFCGTIAGILLWPFLVWRKSAAP